ncbi:MAG: DUF494 family protein [Halanaerobiales bacterium]|nr:DUF494 family protein [Halanaerobiales bacterium]
MNSNIIEIVSLLVQRLLHNEDLTVNEEEIVQTLIELGYDIIDIEMAFELIFSSAEIIGISESYENHTYLPSSMRIFSQSEKMLFSSEAYGILIFLLSKGLLANQELEEIIGRSFSLQAIEIDKQELWQLLKMSIKNRLKLIFIKKLKFDDVEEKNNFWIH